MCQQCNLLRMDCPVVVRFVVTQSPPEDQKIEPPISWKCYCWIVSQNLRIKKVLLSRCTRGGLGWLSVVRQHGIGQLAAAFFSFPDAREDQENRTANILENNIVG